VLPWEELPGSSGSVNMVLVYPCEQEGDPVNPIISTDRPDISDGRGLFVPADIC